MQDKTKPKYDPNNVFTKPRVDIRRQKYKYNRIKLGMCCQDAAIAAGYSRNYARSKAYKIDQMADEGLEKQLERVGLTDKILSEHALDGLKASREITTSSGETISIPDWNIRHRYFETILKLKKKFITKVEHSGNITFTKMGDVTIETNEGSRLLEYDIG